jgi:hypothetical protein
MAKIQNSFPNATERLRIKTLEKYGKLYDNEQQGVLKLHELITKQYKKGAEIIYLAHALPFHISDFYSDFVQGDSEDLIIENTTEDEAELQTINDIVEENDIKERIADWASDQSEYGYEVLLGRVVDGKFIVDEIPQDQYFPQTDGSVIFATYIRKNPNDPTKKDYWLYTQTYEMNADKTGVLITRELWETDTNAVATNKVSDLSVAGITDEPVERIDGLNRLPIVQIDNGKKTKWGFGASDYAQIIPQLTEINERASHAAIQLLKNLSAKMQLPKVDGIVDENGAIQDFEAVVMESTDQPEAKYITNANSLLGDLREHVLMQAKVIALVTGVPLFELLKSNMPDRVESLRIQLFRALRKTAKKRSKIKEGLKELIEIGFKMLNQELKSDVTVRFGDVLPTDKLQEVQAEEIKIRTGISSRFSAIKRVEGYDDNRVENELKLIQAENIQSGAVNPNNAPQLGA